MINILTFQEKQGCYSFSQKNGPESSWFLQTLKKSSFELL